MSRRRARSAAVAPYVVTLLILALSVWSWNWVVESGRVSRIVLPQPADVWTALVEIVQSSVFWRDLRVTLSEILVGFFLGGVFGYIMALVSVAYPFATRVLNPFIVTFQAIPKVVLLPLLAIWVEAGFGSATVIVAMVSFFPIYVSSSLGLRSTDADGMKLLKSLNASRADIFIKYRMPTALPLVFTGIKTAVNYSLVAAITAEFLGAREGLGYRIVVLSSRLALDELYAAVVVTSLVAGGVYLLTEVLDRRVVFWRER